MENMKMAHIKKVINQILDSGVRHDIEVLSMIYHVGQKFRSTSHMSQFIAMIIGQVGHYTSLRQIETAMKENDSALYHLGCTPIPRTTLARLNENQPCELYRELFERLLKRVEKYAIQNHLKSKKDRHKLQELEQLILIDATTIDLCLSQYEWAEFRKTKAGIKLHVELSADGYLPVRVQMTNANIHEKNCASSMQYERGQTLCFDRGYNDYQWFQKLTDEGVFFVTRLKKNAVYTNQKKKPGRKPKNINSDSRITLNSESRFRLVEYIDPDSKKAYRFLTNRMDLSAQAIADIYKERWQIELFFKWIKQNLKIQRFVGRSRNAVKTQIWIALCIYLLLSFLKFKYKCSQSITEILLWVRINLFSSKNIEEYLRPEIKIILYDQQLSLF